MFLLLCNERGGPPRCFSKPPRSKYAKIATYAVVVVHVPGFTVPHYVFGGRSAHPTTSPIILLRGNTDLIIVKPKCQDAFFGTSVQQPKWVCFTITIWCRTLNNTYVNNKKQQNECNKHTIVV
ncbi:hypothetical protein NP493_444g02022 [Ridgeia piscesae]|uniref:Uncharacterized protein n=1 Tax=Ridgeia piscesae TaxID=27915 RepID=A0AAD9NS54_RIDPI|nr:hypothetical protein NP493_444g02022 [Ridgeia piscesae]